MLVTVVIGENVVESHNQADLEIGTWPGHSSAESPEQTATRVAKELLQDFKKNLKTGVDDSEQASDELAVETADTD